MAGKLRTGMAIVFAGFIAGIPLLFALHRQPQRFHENLPTPQLVMQTAHGSTVTGVAFSPNGKLLASTGLDGTLKIWDREDGRELQTLDIGNSPLAEPKSLTYSPDGTMLVSTAGPRLMSLSLSGSIRWSEDQPGDVMDLAFDPTGKWVAAALSDNTVRILGAYDFHVIARFAASPAPVLAVAASPDGKLLASGGAGNEIVLYDTSLWKILRILRGHTDWVRVMAFSPDGKTLASGSDDKTVKLWCTAPGTTFGELRQTISESNEVDALAFSPDGQLLASGNEDSEVKLWEASTGQQKTAWRMKMSGGLSMSIDLRHEHLRMMKWGSGRLAFSPDGRQLARGGAHVVEVWNVDNAGESVLFGQETHLNSVVISPDGNVLAAELGYVVDLWDVRVGQPVRHLWALRSRPPGAVSTGAVSSIAFSPNGDYIASGYESGLVVLWDVKTGRLLRSLTPQKPGIVSGLAISANGRLLAVATENNLTTLWDVLSGVEVSRLRMQETPFNTFHSVVFSQDDKVLATAAGNEKGILLWDTMTGDQIGELDAKGTFCLAVNQVTGSLAAAGNFGIKSWEGPRWKTSYTLPGHQAYVHSVSFSSDGRLLVSGSADNTVKIWDVDKKRELHTFVGYPGGPFFSRDSKWLISAGIGVLVIRNASTGETVSTLVSTQMNEWLVTTPDGLFDGSPGAWTSIMWRFGNGIFDVLPVEAFFSEFYHPGLLADIMTGKRPRAPRDLSEVDRRQPVVKLTLVEPATAGPVTSRTITLMVKVEPAPADNKHPRDSGARDVRLFRNGSLVKIWNGETVDKSGYQIKVPIIAGTNRFTSYSFNDSNVKSKDAWLNVTGANTLDRKGTAYIIAVGINKYSNQHFNLRYAAQDAEAFSVELQQKQSQLGTFSRVAVIPLLDKDARKDNILSALRFLAGVGQDALPQGAPEVLRRLETAQPEDAVFIYYAGHGVSANSHFYMIPHDLGYTGKREELDDEAFKTIVMHGISDEDLLQAFEGIDAGKLVMVIDACNSGQALESEEKRRGPMNSKGLAQLAYEKGMYVLTASEGYQAALEDAKLGHGILTYALVEEGLKTAAADEDPADGEVDVREWLEYAARRVPEIQQSLDEHARQLEHVVVTETGKPPARPDSDRDDRAQHPRVFYRRGDSRPLIITKLPNTKASTN